ncbi:clavesin-2-like [Teleopsis dalmanni]|uniref:clavesin-2-like n=1 Tax=Teleopsis dalmanni TaxID=139649 RepID=UPI0018CF6447|nr:clavesin-2-like [Teleopsis dalmanni]
MSEYFEFQMNKRYESNAFNYFDKRPYEKKKINVREPNEQLRLLQVFKDKIGASINLALRDKSCCSDNSFLNRFLFARKFQCDEALQLLINYFSYKERNKGLLQKINIFDESIQLALRDGNPAVLTQRDRRGRKVITFSCSNWDPTKYTIEDVYRAILLSLDKLLENASNQSLGFVVIVDWTNFTFKQSAQLSPKTLKLMIEGLQDCMPIKFKGIHFIAQPWYVDVALAVIKPFLNDKIKQRLIIHGTNLTTLHNLISKDILPPDLGGEGPSINTLDWYHYLLESSQIVESPRSYRLIETAVYSKVPRNTEELTNTKKSNTLCEDNKNNIHYNNDNCIS